MKHKSGFTLIELLVVIAIIGILSTILMASFTEARMQSRDKIRMSTLKELQLSLEVYKAQNGRYPAAGCSPPVSAFWVGPGPMSAIAVSSWGYFACADYISGLAPDFIPSLPVDPGLQDIPDSGILYATNPAGTIYKIMMNNETVKVSTYDNEFARCPRANCNGVGHCSIPAIANSYAVYSAGGECW